VYHPGTPLKGEGEGRERRGGKEGRGNCAVVNFP